LIIICYRSEFQAFAANAGASLALLIQKSVAHRAFMLPKSSAVRTSGGLEKDYCIV
jgi:hypothetical protein